MFYVKSLEDCITELDTILSEVDTNNIGREIAIVKRSIENLDRMLGLFDLEDEVNLKNANELAGTINDYINYRYNATQAQAPMVDYELTTVQSWLRYIYDLLEANGDINKMSEQFRKNKAETIQMTADARAAHKEQMEKTKAEYEKQLAEMDEKQKELDWDTATEPTTDEGVNAEDL